MQLWHKRKGSIYRRTFWQMTLAILAIFTVLAIVYLLLFYSGTKQEQERQLSMSAEALADRIQDSFDSEHIQLGSRTARGDLMYAARSSGSIIWLVNSRAEIIFYTALSNETSTQLGKSADGHYVLPHSMVNNEPLLDRIQIRYDDFFGLLPKGDHWISVSCSLESETGAYAGEVILHRKLDNAALTDMLMGNGIAFAFFAAFIVAVLLFFFLSHNVTLPIRELVKTAERVYRGDLSARVHLKHIGEPVLSEGTDEGKDDDLTLLVKTMNTLIEKLDVQEKERQDFLSSISHDLRSPLTSVRGFVSGMLDGTFPPEDFPEYLEIVKEETDRLQRLVQDLFQVSLVESTDNFKMTVFDLNELIAEQRASLKPRLNTKGITLSCELDEVQREDGSIPVVGDDAMIARVFQNILVNAVRYTPEGGRIHISAHFSKARDRVEISIEDSGPGISPKDLPHVFDRFYKANKARGVQGSGLGLYIARTVIHKHGQSIEAGSGELLGGARFSFTIATPESVER